MHVVEPPGIGAFFPNGMRSITAVIPGNLVKIWVCAYCCRQVLTVVQRCCRSCTAGELPLRLCRQVELQPRFRAEFAEERVRINHVAA